MMLRRVGRGVSSLPGNPPLRLFCGWGSSPGARTLAVRAHAYLFPVLKVLYLERHRVIIRACRIKA